MANVAHQPDIREKGRGAPIPPRRLTPVRSVSPQKAPAHGMHPLAIRTAMIAVAWFVVAMAISFGDNLETGYLMAIVVGFALVFFTLFLGLSVRSNRDGRWGREDETYAEFVEGEVDLYTGRVSGREALVQLLTLPITLALGGMAIGLVYIFVR